MTKAGKVRYKIELQIFTPFLAYFFLWGGTEIESSLLSLLSYLTGLALSFATGNFMFGSYMTYDSKDVQTSALFTHIPFLQKYSVLSKNPHAIQIEHDKIIVKYSEEKPYKLNNDLLVADPDGEFIETIAYRFWARSKDWKKLRSWIEESKQHSVIKN